jgi:exopolysaccharide biosynthesis polyprenyl glycosylphosphotransferase
MRRGREHAVRMFLTALATDATALTVTFLAVMEARATTSHWWFFDIFPGKEKTLGHFEVGSHLPLLAAILPCWLLVLYAIGVYKSLRITRPNRLVVQVAASCIGAFLLLLGLLWSIERASHYSRVFLAGFALASIPAVLLSHQITALVFRRPKYRDLDVRRVLLIGQVAELQRFVEIAQGNPVWALALVGILLPRETDDLSQDEAERLQSLIHVPVLGTIAKLKENLQERNIHHVFMFGRTWSADTCRIVADVCEEVGVEFSMDANFLGLKFGRADLADYGGWSMLTFHMTPSDPFALYLKRLIDIVGSGLALIVLAPLFALIAIALKLEDGGPVLYTQVRSGLYGLTFRMLKFRSMVVDADLRLAELKGQNEASGPVFKMRRDPRITRVGALIRKVSFDELPQFYNVFVGEMSLVGPRPPIPSEVENYERWQRRRLSMKPGLTCIWQVSGRNRIDFNTWMKMDLQYIDNWSLLLDVKLILKTIPTMFFGTGQ